MEESSVMLELFSREVLQRNRKGNSGSGARDLARVIVHLSSAPAARTRVSDAFPWQSVATLLTGCARSLARRAAW